MHFYQLIFGRIFTNLLKGLLKTVCSIYPKKFFYYLLVERIICTVLISWMSLLHLTNELKNYMDTKKMTNLTQQKSYFIENL